MIVAAWKALAREYHPDRGGDPEAFHKVKAAYEELMDVRDTVRNPT
jgi:curved DNA-binding protein CbpA